MIEDAPASAGKAEGTGTELVSSGDDALLLLAVVRELVATRHTVDRAASATLDSAFDRDLGLDSLAIAELITRVEDRFGVSLEHSALGSAALPRDLLAAVRQAPGQDPRRVPAVRHEAPRHRDRIPHETATVIEALFWHASTHPDRVHLRLLGDGSKEEVSYGGLWRDAASVAAALHARDLGPGDTVAVMLPTGRDYFASFTGVLLAGGVPVPIYPPTRPAQLAEHLRRQVRILDNARAHMLIVDSAAALLGRLVRGQVESLRHVLTPAELIGNGEASPVGRSPTDPALLQYTSGSTADPKGVVLTHANLLANIRAMGHAAQVSPADVFVSWLPLYHDMGLIGAWLSSLYFGLPLAVMPPSVFLARPSRWLWALHAHRGTLTAAPNFAYELCLNRISDAELEGLDLSALRMAFNGAELVSADTTARFAERFSAYGLRRDALAPVYGLAEACVGLTFPPVGREPLVDRVSRERFLRSGRAVPASEDEPDPLRFMACGRALPHHEIRIVDAAGNELGDRREGQIEFRGPSATVGYFRSSRATQALIRRGWLDTGDLGYLDGGELYVTGRIKDLIIRGGRNLHPEELEHAVGDIAGIRRGCVAVFAVPERASGTERLVVLAETRQTDAAALADLRERILRVSVELLGTPPDDVVLTPPGSVLKTSSGKLRRAASREGYQRGQISARRRPAWWQLTRFVTRGVRPWLRRVVRVGFSVSYAMWCWSLLVVVGLPTMVALVVLRGTDARRAAVRQAARCLARLTGTRILVAGADRLAQLPACVVVANHPSHLDGIVIAAVLPGRYTFVAGEVFATKPLSGFFLRRIGTRFVERTDRERGVSDTHRLTEAARGGERLVLFPEGGLSPVRSLRPFRMGAFVIAASVGLPVVPVAISGTREIMRPGHGVLLRRGPVRLVVGEPIVVAGGGWEAAVTAERAARAMIAKHCGEPDLGE